MKKWIVVLVALTLASGALAINPAQRLGRLRNADTITVTPHNRDAFIVFSKRDIGQLLRNFRVDAKQARDHIVGARIYELAFYRGTSKTPMEVLWVTQQGHWGFKGLSPAYGRDPEIVRWIETVQGH